MASMAVSAEAKRNEHLHKVRRSMAASVATAEAPMAAHVSREEEAPEEEAAGEARVVLTRDDHTPSPGAPYANPGLH